jgi:hypothetical protein
MIDFVHFFASMSFTAFGPHEMWHAHITEGWLESLAWTVGDKEYGQKVSVVPAFTSGGLGGAPGDVPATEV